MNFIKNNPFKTIIGIMTICGALITSVWAVDSRYNQLPQIGQIQQQIQNDKIQRLEDQIFVLQMKETTGNATPIDKALLRRYLERLNKYNK